MALTPFGFKLIAPHARGSILSFGYPDILMTLSEASEIVGSLVRVSKHGPAHKLGFNLPETIEVFEALGASLTCVDLLPSRDVETVFDLNERQSFGKFDLVIDAGTIEHCANVGQALMNAANAVKIGGHVFHSPPLTMANHGFYNISPTLLVDFYEQNGWMVKHLSACRVRPPYEPVNIERHKRFAMTDGALLIFLAQRMSSDLLKWPVQWKYIKEAA